MKLLLRTTLFACLIIICYLTVFRELNIVFKMNFNEKTTINNYFLESQPNMVSTQKKSNYIVLAVVVCGDRVQETLVMIKSALIFSQDTLKKIIVVTEQKLFKSFHEKIEEWRELLNVSFSLETREIQFPEKDTKTWRTLFKPCASQRLFLPTLLKDVDSVLYVDTDVLFLTPLENVWKHFDYMNSTQLAALSPEHEDPHTGWYNRFAKHPFYGKLGVNSGVMLMNLTRMRNFNWDKYLLPIYKQYKLSITWGDQDIINILFHYCPERLYVYDCTYNYRTDHCMYNSVCKPAESLGVRVLHGSRGTFHSSRQPSFRAVFQAFQEFQVGSDPYQYLLLPMESYLKENTKTNCDKISGIFLKQIKEFLGDKDYFS